MRILPLLVAAACTDPPVDATDHPPTPAESWFDTRLGDVDLHRWIGTWEGSCRTECCGVVGQTLEIGDRDDGDLDWHITYEGESKRRYRMRATASPTRWQLDEGGGVLIEQHLSGEVLSSMFSVQGNLFTIVSTRSGERMESFGPSFSDTPSTGGPDGYEVTTWQGRSAQVCVLERIAQ